MWFGTVKVKFVRRVAPNQTQVHLNLKLTETRVEC